MSSLSAYSVGESKEFVHEVFGIKFHPLFPRLVRDECDEVCQCGMWPSQMYDRVGVQLMVDEGEPVSGECVAEWLSRGQR